MDGKTPTAHEIDELVEAADRGEVPVARSAHQPDQHKSYDSCEQDSEDTPWTPPDRIIPLINGMKFFMPPQPTDWLIEGFIEAGGTNMVYGNSGTFKSFLALDIALSLSTGQPTCLGFPIPKSWPVLYFAAEGQKGLHKRVHAWAREKNLQHDTDLGGFQAALLPLDMQNSVERMREINALMNRMVNTPRLIVFDTLNRHAEGHNENDAADMGSLLNSLVEVGQLLAKGAVTILVVHHSNKAGQMRGSSAILNNLDSVIQCSREGKSEFITCSCNKDKDNGEFRDFILRLQKHTLDTSESGKTTTTCTLERVTEKQAAQACDPDLEPSGKIQLEIFTATKKLFLDACQNLADKEGAHPRISPADIKKFLESTGRKYPNFNRDFHGLSKNHFPFITVENGFVTHVHGVDPGSFSVSQEGSEIKNEREK